MGRRKHQNAKVQKRTGKGGEYFYIRYRVEALTLVDGKPKLDRPEKHEFLGYVKKPGAPVDAITLRQAERRRDEIMAEVNGQVYKVQSQILMKDLLDIFAKRHIPRKALPTQRTYEQWIRLYVRPFFSDMRLCDIKPHHVQQFLDGLDLADLTKKSIRGLLAAVYKQAKKWGYWTETSPVTAVELNRPRNKYEKRILTPEELGLLLTAVKPDVRLILETLVVTGMRISECLGLRWKWVDLERGRIRVTERLDRGGTLGRTKTEKSERWLPLRELAAAFQRHKGLADAEALVFQDEDGRPYRDCTLLANYLTPIMKRLKIKSPGMGFHMFRRLHATWFDESGATVFETMDQLGHRDVETTLLYIVPGLKRREELVSKVYQRMHPEEKGTIN